MLGRKIQNISQMVVKDGDLRWYNPLKNHLKHIQAKTLVELQLVDMFTTLARLIRVLSAEKTCTTCEENYVSTTWKLTWLNGNSPFLIGDIYSHGCFSIVMLVLWVVYHLESRWLATPISLGLSWPLTLRHLLGVAIAIYFHYGVVTL